MRWRDGVSLIEVLIGMIIVIVASIATLTYFSSVLGNVGRQGNRRAALERARERLEQLMAVNVDTIKPGIVLPASDPQPLQWVQCVGAACGPALPSDPNETINVEDLQGAQAPRLESTIQWKDDPSAGTSTPDVLEFGVKVWFFPGSTVDDDFHRVYLKTLRTP